MRNRVSNITFWFLGAANLALTVLLLVLLVLGFSLDTDMGAISGIAAGLSVSVFSWIGWIRQSLETTRAIAERSTEEIKYYYQSGLSDLVFAMGILGKEFQEKSKRYPNNETDGKDDFAISTFVLVLSKHIKTNLSLQRLFPEKMRNKMNQIASTNNPKLKLNEDEVIACLRTINESAVRIRNEKERLSALIESNNVFSRNLLHILEDIESTDNLFQSITEAFKNLI